jgi:hypothetical protein
MIVLPCFMALCQHFHQQQHIKLELLITLIHDRRTGQRLKPIRA